jgi:hypothetical protein
MRGACTCCGAAASACCGARHGCPSVCGGGAPGLLWGGPSAGGPRRARPAGRRPQSPTALVYSRRRSELQLVALYAGATLPPAHVAAPSPCAGMSAAHVAHAIFEHHAAASAEGAAAADRSDGAPLVLVGCPLSVARALPGPPSAATDALLRKLLHVFTEKQLQRALALVDQVRGGACCPRKGSALTVSLRCRDSEACRASSPKPRAARCSR